jgi:hypothetical protein
MGNVSSFMGDHHSSSQLIMNLNHKRIQHTFDQIFQAFNAGVLETIRVHSGLPS